MEKILCPVDLKPDTLNALEAAARIAAAKKAQLVLLHVFTKEAYDQALLQGNGDLSKIEYLEQQQQAALDRLGEVLLEAVPDLQCISMIRYGNTITHILDEAKSMRASLIVMDSHGVHDITEAMDGNHPVKIIERSPCPVLCMPEGASLETPSKILYGSRMKKEDPDCLQRLLNLLHPLRFRIELVYIGKDDGVERQKWQAHEQLIRSYVPYDKLSFSYQIAKAEVYQILDQQMSETKADMLVLLTHQRNFLQRLFQKSVFKQITYFSDYPVLVFLEDHLNAAEAEGDTGSR